MIYMKFWNRKSKYYTYREQIKILRRERIILLTSVFILILVTLFIFFNYLNEIDAIRTLIPDAESYEPFEEVSYGNISEKDKLIAIEMINNVKPYYFLKVNHIKFIDYEEMNELKKNTKYQNITLVGLNRNDDLYVVFRDVPSTYKTLCHEIYHSYLRGDMDTDHKIMKDIMDYFPCFYNSEQLIKEDRFFPIRVLT